MGHKDPCLRIFLNRIQVGLLRRKRSGGGSRFEFAPSHLEDESRSVLSLGLLDAKGDPMPFMRGYPGPSVDPFFSNMLPEGALRRYLAHNNGLKPDDDFQLLCALGEDLPGAVQVMPDWVPEASADVWADLSEMMDPPAWWSEDDEVDDPFDRPPPNIRFSLAGVQPKHSLKKDESGRMSLPVRGSGGERILKLPFAEWDGVPENEWSMLHLAREAGFETPAAELAPLQSIAGVTGSKLLKYAPGVGKSANGLIVKRFDRDGPKRIHMEDFNQVFRQWPDDKYKRQSFWNICKAVHGFSGSDGATEVARRIALHIMIGNGDAHLKNWTVLHPQGAPSRLSPNYDLVCTLPYIPNDALALKFGGSRAFGMSSKQFQSLAKHLPVHPDDLWEAAFETAQKVREAWRENRLNYPVRQEVLAALDQHMDAMARQAEPSAAFTPAPVCAGAAKANGPQRAAPAPPNH